MNAIELADVFSSLKSKAALAAETKQRRLRTLVATLASGKAPPDLEAAIEEQGIDEAKLEQLVNDQIERRRLAALIKAAKAKEAERAKIATARFEKHRAYLTAQKRLQDEWMAADSALGAQLQSCEAAIDAAGQARLALATKLAPIHLQAELIAAREAHKEADRQYMFFDDPGLYRQGERESLRAQREAAAESIRQLESRAHTEID